MKGKKLIPPATGTGKSCRFSSCTQLWLAGFDVAACADSASPFCAKQLQILPQGTHYFNEFGAFSFLLSLGSSALSLAEFVLRIQEVLGMGRHPCWQVRLRDFSWNKGMGGSAAGSGEVLRAGTAKSRILQDSASLVKEGIGCHGQGGTAVMGTDWVSHCQETAAG